MTYIMSIFHNSAALPICDDFTVEHDPRPYLGEPLWSVGSVTAFDGGGEIRVLVSIDNNGN